MNDLLMLLLYAVGALIIAIPTFWLALCLLWWVIKGVLFGFFYVVCLLCTGETPLEPNSDPDYYKGGRGG